MKDFHKEHVTLRHDYSLSENTFYVLLPVFILPMSEVDQGRRNFLINSAIVAGSFIVGGTALGAVAEMWSDPIPAFPEKKPIRNPSGIATNPSPTIMKPKPTSTEVYSGRLETDPLKIRKMSIEPMNGRHSLTLQQLQQVLTINKARPGLIAAAPAIISCAKKYNVDNVWGVVIGKKESDFETKGAAFDTKSLGNLRLGIYSYANIPYYVYDNGEYGTYRGYNTYEDGIEDLFATLQDGYLEGDVNGGIPLRTPEQIFPVFAPSRDKNEPELYIDHTCYWVSQLRQGKYLLDYSQF